MKNCYKCLKIMIMLGLMFVWSVQPYFMIISMMIITMGYSMFIYYKMDSYWCSYMLILVMMSGVLILFTYIASLIPNESFEYISLIYVSLFMCIFMMMGMKFESGYFEDMSIMMLKMWEVLVSLYNLYFVMFLLMIMLMVVWLSNFGEGAVRNM